jgi:hypothetical protein
MIQVFDFKIQQLLDASPRLNRGQVWCRTCGVTLRVDPAECLKRGWPKCCGQTMTIESPEEQEASAALAPPPADPAKEQKA